MGKVWSKSIQEDLDCGSVVAAIAALIIADKKFPAFHKNVTKPVKAGLAAYFEKLRTNTAYQIGTAVGVAALGAAVWYREAISGFCCKQ